MQKTEHVSWTSLVPSVYCRCIGNEKVRKNIITWHTGCLASDPLALNKDSFQLFLLGNTWIFFWYICQKMKTSMSFFSFKGLELVQVNLHIFSCISMILFYRANKWYCTDYILRIINKTTEFIPWCLFLYIIPWQCFSLFLMLIWVNGIHAVLLRVFQPTLDAETFWKHASFRSSADWFVQTFFFHLLMIKTYYHG